jgi:hypothetical protein
MVPPHASFASFPLLYPCVRHGEISELTKLMQNLDSLESQNAPFVKLVDVQPSTENESNGEDRILARAPAE